jgi:hypothetical protein
VLTSGDPHGTGSRTLDRTIRLVIEDKSKSIEDRRFALRFLIHCIEDMHQPCHVGDNSDKGGKRTQIRSFDRGSNMHALWDTLMIERKSTSEEAWLADLATLDTAENQKTSMGGTVEDWATESLLAARAAYVVPGTDTRLKSGQKLGEEYIEIHMAVVRRRLCQAAVRLACVLNEAFAAD